MSSEPTRARPTHLEIASDTDYCPNLVEFASGIEKPCDYPRGHDGPHGTVVGQFIAETLTYCDAESNGHSCELEANHGDAFHGSVAHWCYCGQTWADEHPYPCSYGEG